MMPTRERGGGGVQTRCFPCGYLTWSSCERDDAVGRHRGEVADVGNAVATMSYVRSTARRRGLGAHEE